MSSISTNKFTKYALGFGARFRNARKSKGLSQQTLGDHLNLKRNTISNYENEKSYPSLEILASLVTVLGVSSDFLLGTDPEANVVLEPKKRYGKEDYAVLEQRFLTLEKEREDLQKRHFSLDKRHRTLSKEYKKLTSEKEALEKALKLLGKKLS